MVIGTGGWKVASEVTAEGCCYWDVEGRNKIDNIYNKILRGVRITVLPCKAIIITYRDCVSVFLVIQDTKNMHRNILLAASSLDPPLFIPINSYIIRFRKLIIELIMCA